MTLYQPQYTITPEIIKKIEMISRDQALVAQNQLALSQQNDILVQSNIDAVHFSTKLEGNPLTREQVTQALTGKSNIKNSGRDLKEVLNYAKARKRLNEFALRQKPFTLDLVLGTHNQLLEGIVKGKLKGHLREAQNVISDAYSKKIVYLPPEAKDVEVLLKSLIKWSHKAILEDTSALIVAPVFHYQFVTIHPFMDGNGRLARLLTNYILQKSGYNITLYASLEKQHEINRTLYYQSLRDLQRANFYDIPTDINLTSWLEYWLNCLANTCKEALGRFSKSVSETETFTKIPDRLQNAVKLFAKYKRLSALDYSSLTGLGRTQAVSDLNVLCQQRVIKKIGGGRSTMYIVPDTKALR